jgi:thiol-disulfide isomerase/thioredoxin
MKAGRSLPLLAVLLAAGAGFVAYRLMQPAAPALQALPAHAGHAAQPPAATPGSAAVAADTADPGATPAELAADPAPPPVPEQVPALTLADMAGKPQPLRGQKGQPRLFNFWATWCQPCRREIPLLNTLESRYRGDRLEVVGIAIDFHDAVADFLKKTPLRYSLLVGEADGLEAARSFGMSMALPFSVFADGDNHVMAVKLGELHPDEIEAILTRMRAVRAGTQTRAQARLAIADDLKALSVKRAQQSKQS